MGQPMPDIPHIYGVDCLAGWDAGETPKYLYARFSMIIQCPQWNGPEHTTPPNDRMFKLTQVDGIPCRWEYFGTEWFIQLTVAVAPLRVDFFLVNNDDGATYFGDSPLGHIAEGFVYHNDITFCEPYYGGAEGIAVVTWTHQATDLLAALNIQRAADLFMELRPLANGNLVYKFCRLKDSMNIKILLEP